MIDLWGNLLLNVLSIAKEHEAPDASAEAVVARFDTYTAAVWAWWVEHEPDGPDGGEALPVEEEVTDRGVVAFRKAG